MTADPVKRLENLHWMRQLHDSRLQEVKWSEVNCSKMPVENAHVKQDSPPAGTLEAYRPLRSEYSFCCPHLCRGGGGYPTSGTPGPDLAWGGYLIPAGGGGTAPWVPSPCPNLARGRGTPPQVTPCPDLARGIPHPCRGYPTSSTPPILIWQGGVPHLGYPPPLFWPSWGTPPQNPDLDGVPPPPIWTWLGYPPRPDWGTPPVDRRMDGQTRMKTLPSLRTTYAAGNNAIKDFWCKEICSLQPNVLHAGLLRQ